jgi:RNA polymerase sigma-70 factor, ECF subfamily
MLDTKRRLPVNQPSISAPCGGQAGGAADSSRARNNHLRAHSRTTSGYAPRRFVPAQAESYQWEAVEEMYLAARPRFVGMAYSILRNKEDAEDAVHDALLSAYLHLRAFEGRSAFTTWFTRIVLNAALMIRRKRKRSRDDTQRESGTTDDTPTTEKIPASQPDPEMVYAESETLQWIEVRLATMSPILRQAFTMTYYDELSNEEAGALLGVTPGTFKSRLLRARRHLTSHVRRSAFAPIRKAVPFQFSTGNNNHRRVALRASELTLPEIALP